MSFTLAILTHCWMMQILKTEILPLHSLYDADIENRNSTITFAHGEGQRRLSIFQDKDSECSLSDPLSDSYKPC